MWVRCGRKLRNLVSSTIPDLPWPPGNLLQATRYLRKFVILTVDGLNRDSIKNRDYCKFIVSLGLIVNTHSDRDIGVRIKVENT